MRKELYADLEPVERYWPGPPETEQYPSLPQSGSGLLVRLNNCLKNFNLALNSLPHKVQ